MTTILPEESHATHLGVRGKHHFLGGWANHPSTRASQIAMRRATSSRLVPVRIEVRAYLSWNLLYSARHLAAMAADREKLEDLPSPIDPRGRAYVLSTVITAITFLDAAINEVYKDAADGPETSYSRRMPVQMRERFAKLWSLTNSGWRSTLERYEMGLLLADAQPLDRGTELYQDFDACVRLRNWIVHNRPERRGHHLQEPNLSKVLRSRNFESNALMKGQGNVWFPDHALGAGCAKWAIDSARAFADEWMKRLDLEPVYGSVDEHQLPPEAV